MSFDDDMRARCLPEAMQVVVGNGRHRDQPTSIHSSCVMHLLVSSLLHLIWGAWEINVVPSLTWRHSWPGLFFLGRGGQET